MKSHRTSLLQVFRGLFRTSSPALDSTSLHGAEAQVLGCRSEHGYDRLGHLQTRFLVDVLIQPSGEESAWAPGALRLLPTAAAATLLERGETGEDLCQVLGVEVLKDRRFQPATDACCTGARRVRLRVQVRAGLVQLCFCHGSALFGSVIVPDEAELLAA